MKFLRKTLSAPGKPSFWVSIGFLFLLVCTARAAFQLHAFRKHPSSRRARYLLKGDWPHVIPFRILMFYRGTPVYKESVRTWAYSTGWVADNWWNRWILHRDFMSQTKEEQNENLPVYPISLSPGLREIAIRNLNATDDRPELLPVLFKDPNETSKTAVRMWLQSRLLERENPSLFASSIKFIVQAPAVPIDVFLRKYWKELDDQGQGEVLEALEDQSDPSIVKQTLGWLEQQGSQVSPPFLSHDFFAKALTLSDTNTRAKHFLIENIAAFEFEDIEEILKDVSDPDIARITAESILDETKDKKPPLAAAAVQFLASHDIKGAETVARPFITGPDSELKKDLIVALANAKSSQAQSHLDEAFVGSAPRTVFFDGYDSFIYGSKASSEYRRLSHHDYLETGKTWPPAGLQESDSPDAWRQFIATYPWFPGTDDAYYRLAALLYVKGDFEGCIATINEYLSKALPDTDADPYIMYLLHLLVLKIPSAAASTPVFQHLQTIYSQPLAVLIWTGQDPSELLASINWFLVNRESIRVLSTTPGQLEALRAVVLVRMHRLPVSLNDDQSSATDGTVRVAPQHYSQASSTDDYARALPLSSLYCRFFVPARPKQQTVAVPDEDPSDVSVRAVVGRVTAILTSEPKSSPEFLRAANWTLSHIESGDSDLSRAYGPPFDLLANTPESELPASVYVRLSKDLKSR